MRDQDLERYRQRDGKFGRRPRTEPELSDLNDTSEKVPDGPDRYVAAVKRICQDFPEDVNRFFGLPDPENPEWTPELTDLVKEAYYDGPHRPFNNDFERYEEERENPVYSDLPVNLDFHAKIIGRNTIGTGGKHRVRAWETTGDHEILCYRNYQIVATDPSDEGKRVYEKVDPWRDSQYDYHVEVSTKFLRDGEPFGHEETIVSCKSFEESEAKMESMARDPWRGVYPENL